MKQTIHGVFLRGRVFLKNFLEEPENIFPFFYETLPVLLSQFVAQFMQQQQQQKIKL